MFTFFETFSIIFVDKDEIDRVDFHFKMVESKYSVKQICVTVEFYPGELNGIFNTKCIYLLYIIKNHYKKI